MRMDVSYSQIAIFDAALDEPFNDWDGEAVSKGMSEGEQSVSFGMPADGTAEVTYDVGPQGMPTDRSFDTILSSTIEVNGGKGVEIATITQSHLIDVANGRYRVIFGVRLDGDEMKCHFSIVSL